MKKFMKRIYLSGLLFLSVITAFPQVSDTSVITRKNDVLLINLLNNTWLNVDKQVKTMPVSVGVDVYGMKTIFKKDHELNMSIGLGISTQNIHNNSLPTDSLEKTYFKPVPGGYEYTKNKFTVCYIDVPLEINYVSMPDKRMRNIRLSIGGRFGYMISNYIKYTGEDFRNASTKVVKFKEFRFDNVMKYRYGIYVRFVYGKIGLVANYSLSPLFEKDKGPEFIPFTYGFSFSIM
jgi:hypothetical protein